MSRRRDERGLSLSVWTAVAMPAFIVAVGLGVDFSGHAAAEQEAREVAAQAARAAAHQVVLTADGPKLDVAAGKSAAHSYAAAAGYTAEVHLTEATGARVTVHGTYDTLFLGIIGVHSMQAEGEGVARGVSVTE
ncbi:MAG: pilus assembly protein [Propionibacteriaceae bacterium]|nr:pilus assembly protein [Propionibacteriaceae bacterium]